MSRFLRPLAVLLFVAAAAQARPVFIPTCYTLPYCTFSPGTWHYSHQCMQNGYVMYVYANEVGDWCLGGEQMP